VRGLIILGCAFLAFGASAPRAFAGTVEGTVTPIEWAQEVEVCIAEVVPGERCVVPGADGTYAFGGLEGEMKFEFVPTYRSRMLTQFYNHKSTIAEATFVTVGREGTIKGIDADLVEGGAIKGAVTAEVGGNPLSEVEVCAISTGALTVKSCDETDSLGGYELHSLPTGPYKVGFWGHGQSAEYAPSYYNGQSSLALSTPVAAVAGETVSEIDATLAKGAQVRGTVAAASGAPLAGVPVCLFVATALTAQSCTETDPAGGYFFPGLTAGGYQVGFSLAQGEVAAGGIDGAAEDGYLSQYWKGAESRSEATTISLLPGVTATGISARLQLPSAPAPIPIAPVLSPIVPAPPVIAESAPKKKKKKSDACKRRYKKDKVKGKTPCIKVPSKGHRKHKKHKHGSKK
jgi:hypothetical protein